MSKLPQLSPFEKKPLDSNLFDFHASPRMDLELALLLPLFFRFVFWRPGWLADLANLPDNFWFSRTFPD